MENHPTGSVQTFSRQLKLLDEVPTELWVEVIEALEPRDVLSLSSVRNRFALSVTILIASCSHVTPFVLR
jgi:hypothetical protein